MLKKIGIGVVMVTVGLIGLGMAGDGGVEYQESNFVAEKFQEVNQEEVFDDESVDGVIEVVDVSDVPSEVSVPTTAVTQTTTNNESDAVQNQNVQQTESSNGSRSVNTASQTEVVAQEEVVTEQVAGSCSGVDINRATKEDLKAIIHINDTRASEMITLRPFASVGSMTRINGIGPARVKDIEAQGLACV